MIKFNKNLIIITLAVLFVFGVTVPNSVFAAGPSSPNLGTAGNFVILTKTGISTTGHTSIVGDIGISPAAATFITGFDLILPSASIFSTSALITGKVYAPGYANPTPTNLTTAVLDMQTAYTDAMGRTNPTAIELGAGNIGGMTLAPGLYKWGTGLIIPADLTLSGSANDVWIFQIAQNLNISSATKIILSGGAKASNIFWIIAGQATIGTTAVFNGNILSQTAIVLNTGAKLNGRALAQTAVTLDSNTVVMPATSATPATPATPASENMKITLQQQINELLTSAKSLQAQIQAKQQYSLSSNFGQQVKSIAINIGQGDSDNNVKILQEFLISQNKGSSAQALAKVGATSYFGVLTRAALAEFQAEVGVSPALGNFGPITRNYINTH